MRKWIGIACLLLIMTALFSAAIVDADTQNYDPTADDGDWIDGPNAYVSDDSYATTMLGNQDHVYSQYGISGDGVVDSVEVGVELWQALAMDAAELQVSWDGGGTWGDIYALPVNMADPDAVEWSNVTDDSVAPSWTWTMLDDTNFQVQITSKCEGVPCPAYSLDYIPVRIYWTPNTAPVIGGADDYAQVTVGNHHDRMFTATDADNNALTWTLTTDCTELSLWQDNWSAGVQGVPKTIGQYYVLLTVQDTWDSDTFNYTLTVVTEDITDCPNCFVNGEIRHSNFLNTYKFELNVSKRMAAIWQYKWFFGDGTNATTTDPFVEHTYWVGAFIDEKVNVTVQVITSSGPARLISKEVTVYNSWQLWVVLIVLGVSSYLLMRFASRVYARRMAESE